MRVRGCCSGIGAATIGFFGVSFPSESFAMTHPNENQERLLELAYSRSKDALQAQATFATSADQRSLVFSTLSVAAAATVFGSLKDTSGASLATGSSLFFCLSALCGAVSAVPGRLYTSGAKAAELTDLLDTETSYASALLGLCKNNDVYIAKNENSARLRAHFYRFAVFLFLFGVGLSLVGFMQG